MLHATTCAMSCSSSSWLLLSGAIITFVTRHSHRRRLFGHHTQRIMFQMLKNRTGLGHSLDWAAAWICRTMITFQRFFVAADECRWNVLVFNCIGAVANIIPGRILDLPKYTRIRSHINIIITMIDSRYLVVIKYIVLLNAVPWYVCDNCDS